MTEVDIVAKYEHAKQIIKQAKEISLEYNDHFFIIKDFLPNKSIQTIYKTRSIEELIKWIEAFLIARTVYMHLIPNNE